MEPKYVVGMSDNPRLRAHVILDHLRQRHLTPVGSLSRDYVPNLMASQPSYTPFTFPLLTVALERNLVNATPHTSPYRDPIEYVLLCCLSDDNLQPLLTFYNIVFSGARVPSLHHEDFALLPKKVPHGIVGNGGPFSNPFVLWKSLSMQSCAPPSAIRLFPIYSTVPPSAVGSFRIYSSVPPSAVRFFPIYSCVPPSAVSFQASMLQTFLCTRELVSRAQFAVWPHTSMAEVLRVVHDWLLFCWSGGR